MAGFPTDEVDIEFFGDGRPNTSAPDSVSQKAGMQSMDSQRDPLNLRSYLKQHLSGS